MIELLLVVVITLLASAIAIPSFVRSYRGAKLRTSVRTVVMMHRYARATAVLKQVDVAILYDQKKHELELVTVSSSTVDDRDRFLDERDTRTGVEEVDEEFQEQAVAGVASEMIRSLEEEVLIDDFESEKVGQEKDGIYWVNYYRNGMCDEYEVRLRDKYGQAATVEVDPLSGKAEVEYE